ncbi:SoxR reducing system RseC family protein [Arthrobacter sp. AK04]|uniref:SoxR reducing system RseC family protein n=1 Tax=Arthrobacter sp. AK04 TaxID=2900048 RepID=UPI001E2C8BF4|nr:SoxR reducing system RseC family protein [Arthrobacter sp. AK04]MCD5341420.1 SoxR reducing system RseC family protein [Arthrobacter sp. AK04]
MVFLFPAIGLLLWIGVLLGSLVLVGILWAAFGLVVGLGNLAHLIIRGNTRTRVQRKTAAGPKLNVPRAPTPPQATRAPGPAESGNKVASEIWPKWNTAHRRYVEGEKSHWQEQFDALNYRE